jgi:trehalose 6-phosphate phosphatase
LTAKPRSVWTDWEVLTEEWLSHRRLLLLLDFDGTLSPFEEFPHRARLPGTTKALVRRLGARPGVKVAVISGRAVSDIRSRVALRSVYYAGNHGLEIEGPGLSFRHPLGAVLKPVLRDLARGLRADCRPLAGVVIENKGMTLSLHYRRLPTGQMRRVSSLMRACRLKTRGLPLRWRRGHKVWELVPDADWDKGRAALHLLHHLRHPFPIVLGDDRTDEDMFLALRDKGTTIRVGCPRPSAAQHCLSSQRETDRFLRKLTAALARSNR